MRKSIRMQFVILSVVLANVLMFGACTYEYEELKVEGSAENSTDEYDTTVVLEESMKSDEEPGKTSVVESIQIPGENFYLICTYDTGDYPFNTWRVTSNKTVNMAVNTSSLPEGYTVHIEHMHADIVLKSTEPQVDGITQDSMDDSDHRVPTKGFYIDENISYNNTFLIEGYTDQFYTMWGYACGNHGSVSSSYNRLTELNLRKVGTYAEKLCVVYDIVISTPECEEGYVKSVYSEVLIPLGDLTVIEKNPYTGERYEKTYRSPLLDDQ
ncbi:MAG: hypothetical protein J6A77_06975 [Lachnospiraceae bacterium]|nr:hypothetical protein [Lachnospiraceae bacterium]